MSGIETIFVVKVMKVTEIETENKKTLIGHEVTEKTKV